MSKGRRMDKEVKRTVKKIFNNLRYKQAKMYSRKSDRIDVDRIIRDYKELDPVIFHDE